MLVWTDRALLSMLTLIVSVAAIVDAGRYGLGTPATSEQIAGWDIDVRADGQGLPPGQGTAEEGEAIYAEQCASCHGVFGEGHGRHPVLIGGQGTLTSDGPMKTIGSYWPYASTVFDYVRRTMPFGHAQSLSDDQSYALTAFMLHINEILEYDQVLDAKALAAIQMPNRNGFVKDERPDVPAGEPCMSNCRSGVSVIGTARAVDVTPENEAKTAGAPMSDSADGAGDAARSK